jgi:hypothetical protein
LRLRAFSCWEVVTRKERVLLVGTDQWITSGPAAKTAAFKGRIHGCTRTFREKVRFPLAPRAPSIHGTTRPRRSAETRSVDWGKAEARRYCAAPSPTTSNGAQYAG